MVYLLLPMLYPVGHTQQLSMRSPLLMQPKNRMTSPLAKSSLRPSLLLKMSLNDRKIRMTYKICQVAPPRQY